MSQEENSHLETTCPHCGAMDQETRSRCEGCGRLIAEGIPEWAQKMPRRGLFGRQGLIFMTQNKWLLIVLVVISVAAVVWHNYHVIPTRLPCFRPGPAPTFRPFPSQANGPWRRRITSEPATCLTRLRFPKGISSGRRRRG